MTALRCSLEKNIKAERARLGPDSDFPFFPCLEELDFEEEEEEEDDDDDEEEDFLREGSATLGSLG